MMEWTDEKPTEPGLYLYREGDHICLAEIDLWKDSQAEHMGFQLYAKVAGTIDSSVSVMSKVDLLPGEWCNVTEFCKEQCSKS